MSDADQFGEPQSPPFVPSEAARGWLLVASGAVLAAAGLSVAGLGASLFEGQGNLGRVVEWLAVGPQLAVLWALLTVARDARDRALWKSSIGFIGVMILLLAFDLAIDADANRRARTMALIATAIGMVGLVVVALSDWPKFADPATAGKDAAAEKKGKGKGCLATAALPIALVLFKILARGARRMKFDLDTALTIEGCVLATLFVVFVLWFALVKIRLAPKFGNGALLLGVFEILCLLAAVGSVAAFVIAAWPDIAIGNEANVDLLAAQFERGGTIALMAASTLWAALAAWLFLSVRQSGKRDWRFEYMPDGVRPW